MALVVFLVSQLGDARAWGVQRPTVEDRAESARESWSEWRASLSPWERRNLLGTDRFRVSSLGPSLRGRFREGQLLREEADFWGEVVQLKTDLMGLGGRSGASAREAEWVAEEVARAARELRLRYRMVRPAPLQNILINLGIKERGLCWHWTQDLLDRLEETPLQNFEPRWGIAREGSFREHNSVVVTARGAPFPKGIVVDPWREGGRLFWVPVAGDRRYPWEEWE